jgi:pimeloyl-ACP methyl ester carboxylesterase
MSPTAKTLTTRTVRSKDGTPIAYERIGSGPALILVDGALCSRAFGPMPKLAPLLAQHFTVFFYDRRGRGDSGDTKPYARAREVEDVEALIMEAGGSAFVVGLSSGAALALEAAASKLNITKLAVYEPPFMVDPAAHQAAAGYEGQLNGMISAGRDSRPSRFPSSRWRARRPTCGWGERCEPSPMQFRTRSTAR